MILPRLRPELNVSPSPDPQNPGLYIRDHYRFTEAWLIIPAFLAQRLSFFDGGHTQAELAAEFARLSNQANAADTAQHLFEALDKAGFLENETFTQLRDAKYQAFVQSPVRQAAHVFDTAENIHATLQGFLVGETPVLRPHPVGIAAPHVSPGGGARSYGAAYRQLTPDLKDRTFVILGTSHYGQANRFGLTRKPFETPLGITRTDPALLDLLAAQPTVIQEDYCHAIEHTIEFQVIFLQHLYGPDVKILPLLCGSFYPSIYNNGKPEDDDLVHRFFETLGEIAEQRAEQLYWILGVDMAHIGLRYGDPIAAHAEQEHLLRVRERDHDRIQSLNAGDATTFWEKIRENHDDLRWCGSAPFYSFLKIMPNARGTLQHYEQWNIDPDSVVSFAGISFFHTP